MRRELVALGADDVEPARLGDGLGRFGTLGRLDFDHLLGLQHDLAEALDVGLDLLNPQLLFGFVGDVGGFVRNAHVERATELDVGTAAGHVGRDRDRAGHAGFGNDVGFLLMETRVQHGEQFRRLARARRRVELFQSLRVGKIDQLVAVLLEKFSEQLGFLDRGRADQHRLQPLVGALDLGKDRGIFLLRGPVDLIVFIKARNCHVGRDLADLELVDVEEFVRLRRRRTGHAGELLIHAEVVLEGDRGERLVFRLHRLMLFCLERLVQALRVAPARHHAPGELVDDDDLAVANDVILVAAEQRVGTQGLVDVMHGRDVLDVVERVRFQQARLAQPRLDFLHAGFSQRHRALLLIDVVVGFVEVRDERVDGVVEFGAILQRTRDDQRRARFVDQDRVHLIDDGVEVAALDHVLQPVLHVVAQIVEAVLVVGAVGDVAGIGSFTLLVVEAMDDHAGGQPEERVDFSHPGRVAAGEVVVDGDDMHALAGQRVEVDCERCNQRLAFAGLHLGNIALMQHHAADQLDVKMPLTEGTLGSFADGREGRNEDVVKRSLNLGLCFEACQPLLELGGLRLQFFVRQLLVLGLQRIDGVHARLIGADAAIVCGTEKLASERGDHAYLVLKLSFVPERAAPGLTAHKTAAKSGSAGREILASHMVVNGTGIAVNS